MHTISGDSKSTFAELTLSQYLHHDPRPSFVLDLAKSTDSNLCPTLLSKPLAYCSPAFDADSSLRSLILQDSGNVFSNKNMDSFKQWVSADPPAAAEMKTFFGVTWTRTLVQSRWSVISACRTSEPEPCIAEAEQANSSAGLDGPGAIESAELQAILLTNPDGAPEDGAPKDGEARLSMIDWTGPHMNGPLTAHQKLARSVDWQQTHLGPMSSWSEPLRRTANFLMADPRPAACHWGPQRVLIYNEQYIEILGIRHPWAMGKTFVEIFTELPTFYKLFDTIEYTHQSITGSDACFHLLRQVMQRYVEHGFLEETYFTWSLIPIFDGGRVQGVYNPALESTRSHVGERRMALLIRVGEMTAGREHLKSFWDKLAQSLSASEDDTPFGAIYEIVEDTNSSASSKSGVSQPRNGRNTSLVKLIGLSEEDPRWKEIFDPNAETCPLLEHLQEVSASRKIKVLDTNEIFPESVSPEDRSIPCRPSGQLCRTIVILPIKPTTQEHVGGFVVIGLNPRRPYDSDHQVFVRLLNRLIDSSMAATILLEEEMRRSKTAAKRAALEQARLQEELAISNRQFKQSEVKFKAFATRAPIGMVQFTPQGDILFANDTWYELTNFDRNNKVRQAWFSCILEEDVAMAKQKFTEVNEKASLTFEIRLNRPPPQSGAEQSLDLRDENCAYTWVLASWYAVVDENDEVESLMSTIMDIDPQKKAEDLQKRRVADALEAKRLQESFIDMTSHEMRNPLSAIIHCCDSILASLSGESDTAQPGRYISDEALKDSLDSVRTILHCSQHQKRIVDDVLNLSRLDAGLLPISPENIPLLQTVQKTISMFAAEFRAADIHFNLWIQESFHQLNIQRVFIDPSRLSQIFINLLANAIKFTQGENKREIQVRMAASRERPVKDFGSEAKFIESDATSAERVLAGTEYGEDEMLYLSFAIQDTGRGLTPSEMDSLFQKFKQANPRTHIRYGGSGLGLYLSKVMCQKMGGAVGVHSEAGKGSTFAFYVLARRSPSIEPGLREQQMLHVPSADNLNLLNKKRQRDGAAEMDEGAIMLPTSPISNSFARYSISVLIVEDNLVNRKVLAKQLRKLCTPIYEANHGLEALNLIKASNIWRENANTGKSIEIILMDVEMPVMDGLTCTREIRKLEASGEITRHIPIIAVTANARQEQMDSCLGAGMDDVVCKPFRVPELLERMRALGVGLESAVGADGRPSVTGW